MVGSILRGAGTAGLARSAMLGTHDPTGSILTLRKAPLMKKLKTLLLVAAVGAVVAAVAKKLQADQSDGGWQSA